MIYGRRRIPESTWSNNFVNISPRDEDEAEIFENMRRRAAQHSFYYQIPMPPDEEELRKSGE